MFVPLHHVAVIRYFWLMAKALRIPYWAFFISLSHGSQTSHSASHSKNKSQKSFIHLFISIHFPKNRRNRRPWTEFLRPFFFRLQQPGRPIPADSIKFSWFSPKLTAVVLLLLVFAGEFCVGMKPRLRLWWRRSCECVFGGFWQVGNCLKNWFRANIIVRTYMLGWAFWKKKKRRRRSCLQITRARNGVCSQKRKVYTKNSPSQSINHN